MESVFLDSDGIDPIPNCRGQFHVAPTCQVRDNGGDCLSRLKYSEMIFSGCIKFLEDMAVRTTETVHKGLDVKTHDDLATTAIVATVSTRGSTITVVASPRVAITPVARTWPTPFMIGAAFVWRFRMRAATTPEIALRDSTFPLPKAGTLTVASFEVIEWLRSKVRSLFSAGEKVFAMVRSGSTTPAVVFVPSKGKGGK